MKRRRRPDVEACFVEARARLGLACTDRAAVGEPAAGEAELLHLVRTGVLELRAIRQAIDKLVDVSARKLEQPDGDAAEADQDLVLTITQILGQRVTCLEVFQRAANDAALREALAGRLVETPKQLGKLFGRLQKRELVRHVADTRAGALWDLRVSRVLQSQSRLQVG